MTPAATLRHDVLLFRDGDDLASSLVPWLAEGVDGGDAAVVAMTAEHNDVVADALGGRARDVTFLRNDEWYARPASTIAGWERLAREASARGVSALRVVGEVRFGDDAWRHPAWTRYESALNMVFADAPAWIVCPYDVERLPAVIVDDAARTHPTIWDDGVRRANERYLDPATLFGVLPEPEPALSTAPVAELTTPADLATIRAVVRAAGERLGVAPGVVEDLVLAVGEVGTNAVRHGGGLRRLRVWGLEDHVVCEIHDRTGALRDPLAGLVPPHGSASGGMGLWVARQLTDWLVVEPGEDGGTVVRFGVRRG